MNRDQFIAELRRSLTQLPQAEVEDIVRDQLEYIQDAVASGRKEEAVIASLGEAKNLAANLQADIKIQRAENEKSFNKQVGHTVGAVFAILALAPLNIIIVLGPFMGILGLLIGGWALAMGLFASSIALFVIFIFKLIFISVGFWTQTSTLLFSLGLIGSGLLALIIMFGISNAFISMTISYLKWNLNFIKSRST